MWAQLLSGVAGGGGGGGTYGNSGSSGVSTPVNTSVGGLGGQSFDLSNRAFAPQAMPTWALLAGVAFVAYLVLRK